MGRRHLQADVAELVPLERKVAQIPRGRLAPLHRKDARLRVRGMRVAWAWFVRGACVACAQLVRVACAARARHAFARRHV